MKKSTIQAHRHFLGITLILVAMALILYDYFSPPVGELSNVTLILFAKIIAIAGSLMNIDIKKSCDDDTV